MATYGDFEHGRRFSEFLDACLKDGPQVVTRRGIRAAVLVSAKQRDELRDTARPTLKELLLQMQPSTEMLTPERSRAWRRPIEPQV